jgi:hypothetical protein
MCDAAGELAYGLHLLRLEKLLARLLQLDLRLAPLAEVAGDLGEADQLVVIINRIDEHTGPEATAVFAAAPALGLIAPVPHGGSKRFVRQTDVNVFGGVKARKVLTNDLG